MTGSPRGTNYILSTKYSLPTAVQGSCRCICWLQLMNWWSGRWLNCLSICNWNQLQGRQGPKWLLTMQRWVRVEVEEVTWQFKLQSCQLDDFVIGHHVHIESFAISFGLGALPVCHEWYTKDLYERHLLQDIHTSKRTSEMYTWYILNTVIRRWHTCWSLKN